MEEREQDEVRALILLGLAEHWGVINPDLNPDLNNIRRFYADGRTVVARLEEVVVATGTIIPRGRGVAEIVRMSVHSAHRRLGVGRLVVNELISTARAWGASKIILETTARWHDVVAFYESNGFRIAHLSSSPFGPDAWLELTL